MVSLEQRQNCFDIYLMLVCCWHVADMLLTLLCMLLATCCHVAHLSSMMMTLADEMLIKEYCFE
jgi:hypothetical protein